MTKIIVDWLWKKKIQHCLEKIQILLAINRVETKRRIICGQKKRARGKKLPKINSCVVWEKGKSFSLTTHANRIDYCLCVKKEKVPGTRSFVFIFRRSRTRARASNRLRVRSVKIFVFVLERGREKKISNTRTVFLSRAVEKIWSFRIYSRRRKTKTNRRKAKTTVFIARRLFVRSRLVVVQIQTYHQTNTQSFSRSVGFLSLSP